MDIGTKVTIKSKNAKAAGKLAEHKCKDWSVIDIMEEVSFSERVGPFPGLKFLLIMERPMILFVW